MTTMLTMLADTAAAAETANPDLTTWALRNIGAPTGIAGAIFILLRWSLPPVIQKIKEYDAQRAKNMADLEASRTESQKLLLNTAQKLQDGQIEINRSQQAVAMSLTQAHASAGELLRACERLHDKIIAAQG